MLSLLPRNLMAAHAQSEEGAREEPEPRTHVVNPEPEQEESRVMRPRLSHDVLAEPCFNLYGEFSISSPVIAS